MRQRDDGSPDSMRSRAIDDDQDVEGHRASRESEPEGMRQRAVDDGSPDSMRSRAIDDDQDVEGHRRVR
jgi:hypothetical protein